eukprot:TRINITY_DN13739_c0_g1_i1.p1 TRINITY_DN13739_c0_g1~~TRINITY_DN13739_c0_g1_i1.p1  ORF type:complete len:963 (+),score=262.56 TRINITY_DN13739_c0_g1_i1:40-2928(+)
MSGGIQDAREIFSSDVCQLFLQYLDGNDLLRCASACKLFCEEAYELDLWKRICYSRWGALHADTLDGVVKRNEDEFDAALELKDLFLNGCPRASFLLPVSKQGIKDYFMSSDSTWKITGGMTSTHFKAHLTLMDTRNLTAARVAYRARLISIHKRTGRQHKTRDRARTANLMTTSNRSVRLSISTDDGLVLKKMRPRFYDILLEVRVGPICGTPLTLRGFGYDDDDYGSDDEDDDDDGDDDADDGDDGDDDDDDEVEEDEESEEGDDEEEEEDERVEGRKKFYTDDLVIEPDLEVSYGGYDKWGRQDRSFPGRGNKLKRDAQDRFVAPPPKIVSQTRDATRIVSDAVYTVVNIYDYRGIESHSSFTLFGKPLTTVRLFSSEMVELVLRIAAGRLNVPFDTLQASKLQWTGETYTLVDPSPLSHSAVLRDVFQSHSTVGVCVHRDGDVCSKYMEKKHFVHFKLLGDDEKLRYLGTVDTSSCKAAPDPCEAARSLCMQKAVDHDLNVSGLKLQLSLATVGPPKILSSTTLPLLRKGTIVYGQYIDSVPMLNTKKGPQSLWYESQVVTIAMKPAKDLLVQQGSISDPFATSLTFPTFVKTFDKYVGAKINTNAAIDAAELSTQIVHSLGIRPLNIDHFYTTKSGERLYKKVDVNHLLYATEKSEVLEAEVYYSFILSGVKKEADAAEIAKARESLLHTQIAPKQQVQPQQPPPSNWVSIQPKEVEHLSKDALRSLYEGKFGAANTAKRTLHNEEVRMRAEREQEEFRKKQIAKRKAEAEDSRRIKKKEAEDILGARSGGVLARERMLEKAEEEKEALRKAKMERERQSMLKEKKDREMEKERIRIEMEEEKKERKERHQMQQAASSPVKPVVKPAVAAAVAAFTIQFALPDGTTKQQEFVPTDTLGAARLWLISGTPDFHDIASSVSLMCSFPRRPYTKAELDTTLVDLKLPTRTRITVHIPKKE